MARLVMAEAMAARRSASARPIDTEAAWLLGTGDAIEVSIDLVAFGGGVHDGEGALLGSPVHTG